VARRRMDVTREGIDCQRGWAYARRSSLYRALSDAAVAFIAAVGGVNALPILRIAGQLRQITRGRGIRRLQECIDVRQVGVAERLRREGRHLSRGLAHITHE